MPSRHRLFVSGENIFTSALQSHLRAHRLQSHPQQASPSQASWLEGRAVGRRSAHGMHAAAWAQQCRWGPNSWQRTPYQLSHTSWALVRMGAPVRKKQGNPTIHGPRGVEQGPEQPFEPGCLQADEGGGEACIGHGMVWHGMAWHGAQHASSLWLEQRCRLAADA